MKNIPDDFLKLLRGGALVWSAYFLLLAVFDGVQNASKPLPAPYILFYGIAVVVVPLLAFLPGLPERLGRAYPVLILSLMGFLPFVGEALILSPYEVRPWISVLATQGIYVRHWLPTFLTASLVAYGYRWTVVVGFVAAVTSISILLAALHLSPEALPVAFEISAVFGILTAAVVLGVSLILQRLRRQESDLREVNEELLSLTATMEDLATSRERNRMARELHDTLAHSLSSLLIQLETVEAYWDVDPKIARELLAQAKQTARSGLNDTRRALQALRANPLDDLGLELALKELAETAAERADLALCFQLPRHLPQFSSEAEQCIYRVAQEATSNVVHHANARHLDLWLSQSDGWVTLTVHDDGIGFIPAEVTHPGHYGVPGMEERASLAGGSLRVTSAPGEGTTIALRLPINLG